MALRTSPFFFNKGAFALGVRQREITRAEVQTPATAVTANIVALFSLDGNKANIDPAAAGLYGSWDGTPEAFLHHVGVLVDNGFDRYLDGVGIQKNDWGVGTLDTLYNTSGMTISWIQRITPAANAVMMQYWQADLEHIDLSFFDSDTLRLSVTLGTGTTQSADVELAALNTNDGNFHHYLVSFNPAGDRIARLYVNSVLIASTGAVTGVAVFGNEITNVRRGIGFGCSFTAPDSNPSGDVDHCVILNGVFPPVAPVAAPKLMENGIFLKYFFNQMVYNPA